MSEAYYNFGEVLAQASQRIESILRDLYPEGKKKAENWCVGDETGAKGQSFQISMKPQSAGCYLDRSDPSVRGNLIALVALKKNLTYQSAGAWLAEYCNVRPEERVFRKKKRPEPQIDKTTLKTLQPEAIAYANSRGIGEKLLRLLKATSGRGSIVLPHFTFDKANQACLLKYWPVDGSKKMWTNKDPIHTLFAKELIDPLQTGGEIIITEGHWDAMTWLQIGYPAVSIPSGVNNDDWIEEDWEFLNQFTSIYLDFDADEAGEEAQARVKTRLGSERCKIINYGHKDANEILQGGHDMQILKDAFKDAREAPVEHIVNAEDLRVGVKQRLCNSREETGVPFFLDSMKDLRFRPHESTLWFGLTGHGKSSAVMNQFTYQAGIGVPGLIASFEDNTTTTFAALMTQFSADEYIGASNDYDVFYDELMSKIHLFDSMQRTSPESLVNTFIMAHRQLGICHFVIDNVMTMDVDRQDNTAQAAVADRLRLFVSRFPVHLHVVAHPRKPQEGGLVRPSQISDVRGASEWGDMSQNAICVYRDMKKAEKLSQMYDAKMEPSQIMEFRQSCGDATFFTRKQRTTGNLPIASSFFDQKIKRFYNECHEREPYWKPRAEEPIHEGTEPPPF